MLSSARASSRRPSRRSHSPYSRCVRASSARTRVRPRWSIAVRNQRSASAPSAEQGPGTRLDAARPIGSRGLCLVGQPVRGRRSRDRSCRSAWPARPARSAPSSPRRPLDARWRMTAAASASSYRPRPLQRTARAYALMASPMPSPRAPASRSVVSIRSVVSPRPASPRREDQRAVRARSGCPSPPGPTVSRKPSLRRRRGRRRTPASGARALRASASSLSVPVSRAISTLERDSEDACSSSQISRATTQPCHSQRSRSLADAFSPASRCTASPAAAGRPWRSRRRGRPARPAAGRRWPARHPVGAARRGRPPRPRRTPTLPLSLAPNSAAENASTYVSRATEMSSGSSRRAAASRSGVASVPRLETNASWARSRSIRARWSSSSGPASRRGQQAASRGERAGLDTGLSGRQRAFTAPRRVRGQRGGALQERRRRRRRHREPALGRPTARARRRRPRPVLLPPARGATRGDRRRRPDR